MESLHRETAPLGIRTLLIEPGRFRTKLLSSGKRKTVTSVIPEYAELSQCKIRGLAEEDQRQPGDPVKLVAIIIDLVKGEGVATGKEIPFRLPLGTDAYDGMKAKCEESLRQLEGWRSVIMSTAFDE